MVKTLIAIRDVDEQTFRKFRATSVEEDLKLGDAITQAMQEWIAKQKPEKKGFTRLLAIKPVKIGTKQVAWSEEIDSLLYGG